MAAPNIVNVSTITGRIAGLALTGSEQDLLENPTASGMVLKVNTIIASNVDGSSSADVTVNFVDDSAAETFSIVAANAVEPKQAVSILDKTTAIYLEEGDKLTALASASGDIELIVSYEEIS